MSRNGSRKTCAQPGEKALRLLQDSGRQGIILAGHPYHVDPEVNHGIPELICATGLAVLTEDSVAHLMPDPGKLRVVDQWTYHARSVPGGRPMPPVPNRSRWCSLFPSAAGWML